MVHIFIGLIVGLIMGLTGAGGALISIPLFLSLLDASLKEATVLSLIAVLFGTSVNLLGKFSGIDKKLAISFGIFGTVANISSMSLKAMTPDSLIAILLVVIGSFSIWSVWQKKKALVATEAKDGNLLKLITTGAFLGIITTLTGLGGGVVLVPILMKYFGKSYEDAIPTSLATIFMVSLSSFLLQGKTGFSLITVTELAFIGFGAILSFVLLKRTLKHISENTINQTRKIVFSLITIYSIVRILLKTF